MEQSQILKPCPYCGENISHNAKKCKHCGEWLTETPASQPTFVEKRPAYQFVPNPQIIVNHVERRSNGAGTAGFVIALISAFTSWIPVMNFILWFLGLLLSFFGMFRHPKGLAVAGFIISILDIVIIVVILGTVGGVLSEILDYFK